MREFAGAVDRQLKLDRDRPEVGSFLRERLTDIVGFVGQFLQGIHSLSAGQFLLFGGQPQDEELHLAFLLAFQLVFVGLIILPDIVVRDSHFIRNLVFIETNDIDFEFSVELLKTGFAFRL